MPTQERRNCLHRGVCEWPRRGACAVDAMVTNQQNIGQPISRNDALLILPDCEQYNPSTPGTNGKTPHK